MTPLTAAERQAMRERHDRDAVARTYCSTCRTSYPCDATRLLDALDATEKELTEARRVAIDECFRAVRTLSGQPENATKWVGQAWLGEAERVILSLLPQPDAPAATAETCGNCSGPDTDCADVFPVLCCGRCTHPGGFVALGIVPASPPPAAPRVTASGSWLAGTASIAGFCGECGDGEHNCTLLQAGGEACCDRCTHGAVDSVTGPAPAVASSTSTAATVTSQPATPSDEGTPETSGGAS